MELYGDDRRFVIDLAKLINNYSRENKSDTPDHVLADYLFRCLLAFESATGLRDEWHGFDKR
jgi:hypothetical protein